MTSFTQHTSQSNGHREQDESAGLGTLVRADRPANGNGAAAPRVEVAEQQFSGAPRSRAELAEQQFSGAAPTHAALAEQQYNGRQPVSNRASQPSVQEQNKALFRRWFAEVWNQGHLGVADEVIDAGFVVHGAGGQTVNSGPAGVKALVQEWRTGFPDGQMSIEELTAEGDRVVAHLVWRGTHSGPFYGIAPTGKQVEVTSIGIDRLANGKIVEGWGEVNMLGMMQQLGALPAVPELPGAKHKRIFRRFAEEAWNQGKLDVVWEVFAPEYVAHAGNDVAYDVHGPEGHAAFIAAFRQSFPDVHLTFDHMVAEGDILVVRMHWTGTHTGVPYMGVPASGKRVNVLVTGVNRFVADRVVEAWGVVDMRGLMQQLGIIPGPSPQEINKALVRRYIDELWNAADLDVATELFAPLYRTHMTDGVRMVDHEPLKAGIIQSHRAFPDFHMALQHMVADGDKVTAHWVINGTHLQPFELPGMPAPIPPTGNKITVTEIGTFRFAEGRIVEAWYMPDELSMLQQLGAIPTPGGSPAQAPAQAGAPANPEANKAVFRRLIEEFWNGRKMAVLDEIYAPQATAPHVPGLPPGPAGVKLIAQQVFAGFPDFHMTIEDMVAEGEWVTARFVEEGTHTGPFMGLAPTGKHAAWTEIGSVRIKDGQIVETVFETDMLTMLQQLDLVQGLG